MTVAVGFLLAAALGLTGAHLLDLDRVRPSIAVAVCLAALVLRAALSVVAVVAMLVFVPSTAVFDAVTHWCWHTVLPVVRQHLPLNGHVVGDVSLLVPAMIVLGSVAGVVVGVWRGVRTVRRLMRRHGVGRGPDDSLIITDPTVALAAVGVRRPKVLVSTGALLAMDDDELFAGLAHERGHIAHRHGVLIPVGHALAAVGRLIPWGDLSRAELEFHLERQADAYALRSHAPLSLASAICKAAIAPRAFPTPAINLSRVRLQRRVDAVLAHEVSDRHERLASLLAGWLVLLTVVLGASGVAAAAGEPRDAAPRPMLEHCE